MLAGQQCRCGGANRAQHLRLASRRASPFGGRSGSTDPDFSRAMTNTSWFAPASAKASIPSNAPVQQGRPLSGPRWKHGRSCMRLDSPMLYDIPKRDGIVGWAQREWRLLPGRGLVRHRHSRNATAGTRTIDDTRTCLGVWKSGKSLTWVGHLTVAGWEESRDNLIWLRPLNHDGVLTRPKSSPMLSVSHNSLPRYLGCASQSSFRLSSARTC